MIKPAKPAARKSKYGEGTTVRRIPNSMLHLVDEMLSKREVLEHKWNISMLPPVAQNVVEAIVELMIIPQIALVDALQRDFESTGGSKEVIEGLRKEIKFMRSNMQLTASEVITRAITHDQYSE